MNHNDSFWTLVLVTLYLTVMGSGMFIICCFLWSTVLLSHNFVLCFYGLKSILGVELELSGRVLALCVWAPGFLALQLINSHRLHSYLKLWFFCLQEGTWNIILCCWILMSLEVVGMKCIDVLRDVCFKSLTVYNFYFVWLCPITCLAGLSGSYFQKCARSLMLRWRVCSNRVEGTKWISL